MSIFSGLLDVRLLQVIIASLNAEEGFVCFQFTRGRRLDFTDPVVPNIFFQNIAFSWAEGV